MYDWPLSGGPPNPQGVAVVQIDSPAYQTRLAFRNAAPTRGLADREWIALLVRSRTSPTWLVWAFSTENAMRLPSGLAYGRIQLRPALTVETPLGLHACTPAPV